MAGSYAVTVEYVPECRRAADLPQTAEAGIAWHELITVYTTDDVIRRWWSDPRRDRRRGPR